MKYHAENGIPLIPDNKSSRALKPTLMQYFRTAKDCGWGHADANRDSCVPNPQSWTEEQKNLINQLIKLLQFGLNKISLTIFP